MWVKSLQLFVAAILAEFPGLVEVAETETVRKGVVIEEVGKGSALEKAKLLPGDVVLAWKRLPASPEAEINSVFDWIWLKKEQAPQGKLRLYGERGNKNYFFDVPSGYWKGDVRPHLPDRLLDLYHHGRHMVEHGAFEQGIKLWHQILAESENAPERIWIRLRIGEAHAKNNAWAQALEALMGAMEEALTPTTEVTIRYYLGQIYVHLEMLDEAEEMFRPALNLAQATWGTCLHSSHLKERLGFISMVRSQLELASSYFKEALEIRMMLAPDSIGLRILLNYHLGSISENSLQFESAKSYYQRALELTHANSFEREKLLRSLGSVALKLDQLNSANIYYQHALEVSEKLAPDSLRMAGTLHDLESVARARGQLGTAAAYHQRGLEISAKLVPSLRIASGFESIGLTAYIRRQFDLATIYHLRALEIVDRLAPDSLQMASILNHLGDVAFKRSQLDQAKSYYQRALEIMERLAPNSLRMSLILRGLGRVAEERGQLGLATSYLQRTLKIEEKLAPNGFNLRGVLNSLVSITEARGQSDA